MSRTALRLSVGMAVVGAVFTTGAFANSSIGANPNGSLAATRTSLQVRQAAPLARTRTYRLLWPSRPDQSATYHLGFKSAQLRAVSLQVYRVTTPLGWATVPRGFGFSYLVACEHRGPASLNWNWRQRGSAVRVTVKMTTGSCFFPGPQVAGTYAAIKLRLVP